MALPNPLFTQLTPFEDPSLSTMIGANPVVGNTDVGNTDANITDVPVPKPSLEELLTTLIEHLTKPKPPKRKVDYEKPPIYNVPKLKKGVIDAVLQDWLAAVQAGDRMREYCSQEDRVMWANTAFDDELPSDWRTHERALKT